MTNRPTIGIGVATLGWEHVFVHQWRTFLTEVLTGEHNPLLATFHDGARATNGRPDKHSGAGAIGVQAGQRVVVAPNVSRHSRRRRDETPPRRWGPPSRSTPQPPT